MRALFDRLRGRQAGAAQPGRRFVTPTILQLEAVECGAASLAMVLAGYKRWVPLDELRIACGVSRDGSRAGNVVRAARGYGFEAKGYRYPTERLAELPMPAIVFVNLNHFVVLEGFVGAKVHLNDPAAGRRVLTMEEFDREYSGVVLTFVPTPDFKPGGSRAPVLDRLVGWLDGAHPAFVFVVLAGVMLVLPGIAVPAFTRIFVDQYLVERQQDWVLPLLGVMVVVGLVQAGLSWLRQTLLLRLQTRIALRAASRFVWRMIRLPVGFFAQRYAGGIGGRVDLALDLADEAGGQLTGILIQGAALLFFALVMTAYSPLLAFIVILCAAGNLLLFQLQRRRLEEMEQKATLDQVKLGGKTMQGLQMIEQLKANGTDQPFFEGWAGLHALVASGRQRIARSQAVLVVLPEFLAALSTIAVLVVGGLQVIQGALTIGMLVAFQSLQGSFAGPVQSLMQAGLKLQRTRGSIEQLEDVLETDVAPEFAHVDNGAASPAVVSALGTVSRLSGAVSVRGVTFGYSRLEPPLIESFDLDIAPGTWVALVGASGSGKSTLGKLVSGLYAPWEGEVLLDGMKLTEVPRPLLRQSVAVVDQEIVLFEGTVRENVTLWDDTMPEEQVIRAARDAEIHETLVERPGGYEARVAEAGRNFSGGQRQRIEIARALVGDPTLLVLDEATSALDPVVEKSVMDNLRRRGCACLIIAHRLSTIRDCDEIIVLDRGKVLQRGTHQQMIAVDGPYRRLIEA